MGKKTRATWFCVDIECSGPVPALYDCLSIGVVPVHHRGEGFVLGQPAYWEIRPTAPRVDPGAMKVNKLDLEKLKRDGLPLATVLRELTAYVAQHTDEGAKPVFVGHNAPFDWSFVSYAYHSEGQDNPFGYKALDTKALAMGVLGIHWFDTNKEILEQRLGLPPQDPDLVHRADYDAAYQAQILVGLLERMPKARAEAHPDS